jgi:mannosylglycerate hydrolase
LPQKDNVWDFDIVDDKGNKLTKQLVSRKEVRLPVSSLHSRPYPYFADRIEVVVKVDNIPAMGYKVFKIVKTEKFIRRAMFWKDIRTSECREISKSLNSMENDFLKVTVNGDGTVKIFDKKTNETYNRLNYFEDTGDNGDYWIYYPPYKNRTFTSIGQNADIWIEENGEVSATIGVKINMELPKFSTQDERSAETIIVPIEVYYTLNKGENKLNVRVKLDNTARDHKMRIMFDTEIKADLIDSAGHFTVDSRPIIKDGEKHWPEMQTLPMGYYVKRGGFGIVHDSFCEYEAYDNDEGTLAISLFRAVKNIICTEARSGGLFLHENGGQNLGEQTYEYAICFDEDIFKAAESFNAPIKAVQTNKGEGTKLPLEKSWLEIDNVVVTAIKKACGGDDTIIRFFNPTDKTVKVNLGGIKVNLNEEEIGDFDGKVKPFEIVSVKLEN